MEWSEPGRSQAKMNNWKKTGMEVGGQILQGYLQEYDRICMN